MNLYDIKDPSFLKTMSIKELNQLADEIRQFLIQHISKTGGHLSSNLGIVELTIALHYLFDSPKDKLFFDVGHQSYVHKILTGRANQFDTLRQYQGLSGFQKRKESEHDVWEAGHSSTALSAAVGMAFARDLNKEHYHVVPVIGDGAMVGGESLEALNHLGSSSSKVIIVLNDNEMSISKNVGGVAQFLSDLRLNVSYNKAKQEYKEFLSSSKYGKALYNVSKNIKNYIKKRVVNDSIFTEFGVDYLGPIDGHDFNDLIRAFTKAKNMQTSVVVHVITKKGKGYPFAENDKTGKWHGVGPFNVETGEILSTQDNATYSWSEIVTRHLHALMHEDQDIVAITPAMREGSKMQPLFKDYPERSFDVGIAESHAVTFAAGLACSNKKPFISIYSSFLQRAYDQINHDLARMDLFTFISIDRAGLVGQDGETHHGVFDIGFLSAIPNVVLFSPASSIEAKRFMNTAFKEAKHPCFMRLSRANILDEECAIDDYLTIGSWRILQDCLHPKAIIISYSEKVMSLLDRYKNENYMIIDARFLKPIDQSLLDKLTKYSCPIFVYETSLLSQGLNTSISLYYQQTHQHVDLHVVGIKDHFTPQGSIEELEILEQIDMESFDKVLKEYIDE